MAVISEASPKYFLKIDWIAPFHAKAATNPKAAVIKAANFSITLTFNFSPPLITDYWQGIYLRVYISFSLSFNVPESTLLIPFGFFTT